MGNRMTPRTAMPVQPTSPGGVYRAYQGAYRRPTEPGSPRTCLDSAHLAQDLAVTSGAVRYLRRLVEVSPPGLDAVVMPKQDDTQ